MNFVEIEKLNKRSNFSQKESEKEKLKSKKTRGVENKDQEIAAEFLTSIKKAHILRLLKT